MSVLRRIPVVAVEQLAHGEMEFWKLSGREILVDVAVGEMSALSVDPHQRDPHQWSRIDSSHHRSKETRGQQTIEPHQRHALQSNRCEQAQALRPLRITAYEMVDEGTAKRVTDEGRALELEGVENVAEMIDERVDSVLGSRHWLVRQAMSLQVNSNGTKASLGECRHIAAKHVRGAAPAMHQHDWRRSRISPLDCANHYSGAKARQTHAISRVAGGKHLAGAENATATESDHRIRSIQFLCREVFQ